MFQLSYSLQSSLLTILFCIYCSCFNSLIALIVTAHYFILYILFMFQLSYSLQSSLLIILFRIYCSCFNSLIRFYRHCLLFYSVYIVQVSTLLFVSIVTAYYFILYILFMFHPSYSL